jgi:hypothetical protein
MADFGGLGWRVAHGWSEGVRPGLLGHVGIPGLAPFVAMGLFFAGIGAAVGAYWMLSHRGAAVRRATGIGLGVVAFGCLGWDGNGPAVHHSRRPGVQQALDDGATAGDVAPPR